MTQQLHNEKELEFLLKNQGYFLKMSSIRIRIFGRYFVAIVLAGMILIVFLRYVLDYSTIEMKSFLSDLWSFAQHAIITLFIEHAFKKRNSK